MSPEHMAGHRARWEEFVRGDPFVLNGVIRNWYIRDWIEALVPD
jgi:hypothetical protein